MHVMPFRDPNSKPEVKEATGTIKPELAGKTRESQASKKGDRERGKGGIRGQGKGDGIEGDAFEDGYRRLRPSSSPESVPFPDWKSLGTDKGK